MCLMFSTVFYVETICYYWCICIVGEVAASLLHSLRTRREEEEENPLPKRSDSMKVGSRISSKLKNLYSTDDEDNGLFYQPPNRRSKPPQEIR